MISKELLSEVLKMELFDFDEGGYILPSNEQKTVYVVSRKDSPFYINIHELAHKVKEWAFDEYELEMFTGKCKDYGDWLYSLDYGDGSATTDDYTGRADTEPEAIFKAGEWILENR